MYVVFEFKDNTGKVIATNNMNKEMSYDEIKVILLCKEIGYPVNLGILYTIKQCEIENTVYDMVSEPYKLKLTLIEIQ